MSEAISAYHGSSQTHKSNKLAICLVIVLVWQINALNSRPATGQSYSLIEDAILPKQHNDDGDLISCNPWGITLISKIITSGVGSRLANGMALPIDVVQALTHHRVSYETVELRHAPAMKKRAKSKTIHVHNRQPLTSEAQVPENAQVFNLEALGAALPVDEEDEDNVDDPPRGLNEQVSALWSQFLADLLIKAPNPRRGSLPYCRLDIWEKEEVGEEGFKNPNLAIIWNIVAFRRATPSEWTSVFDRLFPSKVKEYAPTTQNYTQCRWLQQWGKMLLTMDPSSIHITRTALRQSFDQLLWIPAAKSDRIWETKQQSGFTKYPRMEESTWTAPKIFINPKKWRSDLIVFTPITNTQQEVDE